MSSVVVRSLVRTGWPRPDAALVARIGAADVTRLSELVGRMYTMDASILPLGGCAIPVAGVATTAKCPPGDNLGLVRALGLVEPGDVLVVDAQSFRDWCLGGFQLLRHAQTERGLAGLLVNGAYRDVADARDAGFPVYATGVAPYSGPKMGPFEVNVPVCCGGVVVQPGDVVSASAEGIVVVPLRAVGAVAEALAASQVAHGDPDALRKLFARAQAAECDLERVGLVGSPDIAACHASKGGP
jgi:regulator of RNase E activity RraA